jgi:tetratricopeptide (TPR) repeat protein
MPHERNSFFTGRDTELALLRDTLASHRNGALTQAIRGLGGQGKSSVAVEYAFRCHERKPGYPAYDTILWTRADSVTDLYTGYGKIAEVIPVTLLDPGSPQQIAADVRRWLETHDNWLLIYDNADDPDLLKPFRPRNANGHILLTSRASSFKGNLGIKQPIELRSLRPEDAVSFLFDRTNRKPEEEGKSEQQSATNLAAQLGYFPLALEQAAAYIAENKISFTDYLANFRKRDQELLNETPPETSDYRFANEQEYKTLRTTWDLNLRVVEQSHPATAELLRFSAFLASDDIPYWLIVIGASELGSPLSDVFADLQDEVDRIRACDSLLKPLLRYSLIEKNCNEHTFSVHRMVQSVQRDRLNAEREGWFERTVRAVCAVFPTPEFENWEWCAALLPHALTCLTYARKQPLETEATAALLVGAGYYLVECGLYKEAEPLFREALAIWRKALPEGHPDIATSLNNLAELYRNQGRYGEAEPLYLEALAIWRKALPEGHPDIATSLNNLALLYHSQGRYAEAEPLFREALAIRQKALPEGHPDIAQSLNNLALLYDSQGRYAEAEPLYQEASSIMIRALGVDHPNTQTVLRVCKRITSRISRPILTHAGGSCSSIAGRRHAG